MTLATFLPVESLKTGFRHTMALLPSGIHSAVLGRILTRIFRTQIAEHELEFFKQRILEIQVRDLGLSYRLTFIHDRIQAAPRFITADACFAGDVKDFLDLAAEKEDPDTLFFQRRLRMSGDTELGLYFKNFLAALDKEQLPALLNKVMPHASKFYERFTAS